MLIGASNPQYLWYLTRGFGLISLVLLTATVVLGISQVARFERPGLPRFVVSGLHRNLSLLAVVFVAIHVVTSILDPYVSINLVDVFVPFVAHYRPIWLGFGAVVADLLVALVVTSLLRERIGYRVWRSVHWAAYASWPVALVHGLGTGSDSRQGWVQVLYLLCLALVLSAITWRLGSRWTVATARRRAVGGIAALALTVGVGAWSLQGPLEPGWSHRAGAPGTARPSVPLAAKSPGPHS